jgi:hypothetical protein
MALPVIHPAARKKSTRHSKITGDFAEALVLYWLSKVGYECARVDHTGIDLIARVPNRPDVIGISVKCRDRYEGRERASVNLGSDGFEKARRACEAFGCTPYYAIVVDAAYVIRCFLLPLDHLETIVGGVAGRQRYWRMREKDLKAYRADGVIQAFELVTELCSWTLPNKPTRAAEPNGKREPARRTPRR